MPLHRCRIRLKIWTLSRLCRASRSARSHTTAQKDCRLSHRFSAKASAALHCCAHLPYRCAYRTQATAAACQPHSKASRRCRRRELRNRPWCHPLQPPSSATVFSHPLQHTAPGLGSPLPHRHQDRAHRCHICTGTGLTAAASEPGLGWMQEVERTREMPIPGMPEVDSEQPNGRPKPRTIAEVESNHGRWAHPCHSCAGTGLTPATLCRDWAHPTTSAPGLGSPLPHLHRHWARPCHICTAHLQPLWAHPRRICTGTGPA